MVMNKQCWFLISITLFYLVPINAAEPDAPAVATANQTDTNGTQQATLPAYKVKGFRRALFGQNEAQVREAIKKDFGVKGDKIISDANHIERTQYLSVQLAALEPGSGPVRITYIFGYKTKQLIQVNIIWSGDKQGAQQALRRAAISLLNYFSTYQWQTGSIQQGQLATGETLFFKGTEVAGSGTVMLTGHLQGQDADAKTEKIKGNNRSDQLVYIRLAYVSNTESPDVFKLRSGDF